MKTFTKEDFQRWGAQGGAKSRRTLDPQTAHKMALARIKKLGQKRRNK
jgi:hypothetical protein